MKRNYRRVAREATLNIQIPALTEFWDFMWPSKGRLEQTTDAKDDE